MGELTPSDAIALAGGNKNGNNGWGDGNGWWIILLFMIFGWGGNRGNWGNQGGYGGVGGNELYPWLNQANLTTQGFADQNTVMALNGLQTSVTAGFANAATQLCQCCSEMQMALANGFFGIEQSANARQMANMQAMFNQQLATQQGFNGVQGQLAQQTATILSENCADRAALSDGVRDIIQSQTANTQKIMDKLCDLELQGVRQQLDDERRANANLQNQLNMATIAASQATQNAFITQGFANEVDALYNRLSNCPVPTTPVYGRTPIFTCNNGCGCGAAA